MLSLRAKVRKDLGKKIKALRKKGLLPAVLYGPKIKTALPLEIDSKEFEKLYKEAGHSSLVSIDTGSKEKFLALIQNIQRDPLTDRPIHVEFYQPSLEEKVQAKVPIIFEGEAPAVKDLGGTLVKNISELEVKALPQNLPKEIRVNVEGLKTFEDAISVKDLRVAEGVEILKNPKDTIARVTPPVKVEEELAKPIEEKVEEVEKVGEEEKEEKAEKEEAKKEEDQEEKEETQQKDKKAKE